MAHIIKPRPHLRTHQLSIPFAGREERETDGLENMVARPKVVQEDRVGGEADGEGEGTDLECFGGLAGRDVLREGRGGTGGEGRDDGRWVVRVRHGRGPDGRVVKAPRDLAVIDWELWRRGIVRRD